jgi:AhpD family alkylhydroperoxidase
MARLPLPTLADNNADEISRAFSLSPAFAKALGNYSAAIYGAITLSMREREAVRMRIAQLNQCQICLGFRFPELHTQGVTECFYAEVANWKNSAEFSPREKLAMEYAELFLTDHLRIDDAFFARLNNLFNAEEVFELTGIIAGLMANGRLMQVLQLNQPCAI